MLDVTDDLEAFEDPALHRGEAGDRLEDLDDARLGQLKPAIIRKERQY